MLSFSWRDLPIELEIEILQRLPVKTLIRFSCVCKSWKSIINDPFFISKHLNQSTSTSTNILKFSRLGRYNSVPLYSVLYMNTFDEISHDEIPNSLDFHWLRVVGSCNGIICMTDCTNHHVSLWNPSVRKCMTLTSFGSCPWLDDSHNGQVFGFAFDPQTIDYKLVRILYYDENKLGPVVELYTHNTGIWRSFNQEPKISSLLRSCRQSPNVFVNGAIHWMAGDEAIISFDIGEEIFQKIELPAEYRVINGRFSILSIEESLGLFFPCLPKGGNKWVMKEYGYESSWTKLFTVELREEVDKLSPSFSKYTKPLLLVDGDFIVLYNPENHQFMCIQDRDIFNKIEWITFTESLVWLERGTRRFTKFVIS